MADDPHNTSDVSDRVEDSKEDAETRVARKELRQTAISDKDKKRRRGSQDSESSQGSPAETPADDADGGEKQEDSGDAKATGDKKSKRTETPDLTANDEDLKEQVSSPKKKRAHAELDQKDDDEDDAGTDGESAGKENGAATGGRTDRSEPEKKRARDESSSPEPEATSTTEDIKAGAAKDSPAPGQAGPPTTSASAFASSAFSKLASSSTSPFGALGASSTKPSVFASASSSGSASPFGSLAAAKPGTSSLSFGATRASGSASPFGSLNSPSKGFGGVFGSALAGPKITSWGTPGEALKSVKPARPFGAPESDAEDDNEQGGEDEESKESTGDGDEEKDEPEKEKEKDKDKEKEKEQPKVGADEKKKKLQRVVVDDGEAGEVTILSVRARLYHLDTSTAEPGWKERGVGMLKINVPEQCVSWDDTGRPIPGSFDASALDEEDEESNGRRIVRLVMRQDSTLRVILNTVLVPAMDFQEKPTLKSTSILFTAFEGETAKPVSMSIRLNAANAKAFIDEVGLIKRELSQA